LTFEPAAIEPVGKLVQEPLEMLGSFEVMGSNKELFGIGDDNPPIIRTPNL